MVGTQEEQILAQVILIPKKSKKQIVIAIAKLDVIRQAAREREGWQLRRIKNHKAASEIPG